MIRVLNTMALLLAIVTFAAGCGSEPTPEPMTMESMDAADDQVADDQRALAKPPHASSPPAALPVESPFAVAGQGQIPPVAEGAFPAVGPPISDQVMAKANAAADLRARQLPTEGPGTYLPAGADGKSIPDHEELYAPDRQL